LPKFMPILIAVVGIILLAGGASTYIAKSSSTAACEACGMEITKEDISAIEVVSESGEAHWACCPVCAMVVSMYYQNATLHAHCFSCNENTTVTFAGANIMSVTPSDGTHNVTMIFGMSCMMNKLVCSNECADNVRATYDWASALPSRTMSQTFGIAQSKYAQFTVGYKVIQTPTITYGLIAGGSILLVVAPLEWVLVERRKAQKEKT